MKVLSNISEKLYEANDMVFFKNTIQSCFYLYHGAKLIDLDVDYKNGKYQMIYVFTKKDHDRLKLSWKHNKEKMS